MIVNVDTSSRNDPQLNETPFKILQESYNFGKKITVNRSLKKHYHYMDNLLLPGMSYEPELTNNNAPQFDQIRLKSISQNHTKNDYYPHALRKEDSSSELIQRKYAAIDKKCDDYITKHEELHNKYKMTKNQS